MTTDELRTLIRDVPDFPRPGVVFKDISPLLAHPRGFRRSIELLAARIEQHTVDSILAVESRGFIFAAPLAAHCEVPLHLVRKAGKLPFETTSVDYDLEYGSDKLEVHVDVIEPGIRYAVVDDVLATGGTAAATGELVHRNKGELACYAFLIELAFLQGRARLGGHRIESLLHYE